MMMASEVLSDPCFQRLRLRRRRASAVRLEQERVPVAPPPKPSTVALNEWVDDLCTLLAWDELRPAPSERRPPVVVLDGANLCWAYGKALTKRFGCKTHPFSAGLVLALEHAPWRDAHASVSAILPESYARAPALTHLVDGCGGDEAACPPASVARDGRAWRCLPLCALSDAQQPQPGGRVRLVSRLRGADDDVALLREARASRAFVVSNDQFREHGRLPKSPGNTSGSPTPWFRSTSRFAAWAAERRLGAAFAVAPGIDDELLLASCAAAAAARGERAPTMGEVRARPWRFAPTAIPVVFQPVPGTRMLAARSAAARRLREGVSMF